MTLFLSLVACGGSSGTWLFRLVYAEADGDECSNTPPTHNFLGAYTPPAAAEDLSWEATTTRDYSEQLFFGRIETTDVGAVLVLGDAVYPGSVKGGSWSFAWTRETTGADDYTHVTGYTYTHDYTEAGATDISGEVSGGSFVGTWTYTTSLLDAYTESDTWSDEAAAYVGTGGLTPVGTYLLKLDGTGVEVPASNTQTAYDCNGPSCTLTVQEGCSFVYDLTALQTDLGPEDASWADSAVQPAGAG